MAGDEKEQEALLIFSVPFSQLPFILTADHVSHLENVSEDEINRLLGMVVDVENLFMSVHKEEDTDTKQVYFYLFKVSFFQVSVRG